MAASSFVPAILVLACSSVLFAAERTLTYEGDVSVYRLTFDNKRISTAEMRKIACLAPFTDYCAPFEIGGEPLDKEFSAPELELCSDPCAYKTDFPDAAFLKNAALNLQKGEEMVETLRREKVPAVLRPVQAYLLKTLEHSLEKQEARYQYLKWGNLAPMREILCSACACGTDEENLLRLMATTDDGRQKRELSRVTWGNKVLACERARHPATYPMGSWQRFVRDYGIREQRRYEHIE